MRQVKYVVEIAGMEPVTVEAGRYVMLSQPEKNMVYTRAEARELIAALTTTLAVVEASCD
jgi:hypothetical protein